MYVYSSINMNTSTCIYMRLEPAATHGIIVDIFQFIALIPEEKPETGHWSKLTVQTYNRKTLYIVHCLKCGCCNYYPVTTRFFKQQL